MDVTNLETVPAFVTKDGSEIRELLAHRNSCIEKQSLAEARIGVGQATTAHYHKVTEEIYFITAGTAEMQLGEETQVVSVGDSIAIPPGVVHKIINTGEAELRLLCCCPPPYEDADTVLVE